MTFARGGFLAEALAAPGLLDVLDTPPAEVLAVLPLAATPVEARCRAGAVAPPRAWASKEPATGADDGAAGMREGRGADCDARAFELRPGAVVSLAAALEGASALAASTGAVARLWDTGLFVSAFLGSGENLKEALVACIFWHGAASLAMLAGMRRASTPEPDPPPRGALQLPPVDARLELDAPPTGTVTLPPLDVRLRPLMPTFSCKDSPIRRDTEDLALSLGASLRRVSVMRAFQLS